MEKTHFELKLTFVVPFYSLVFVFTYCMIYAYMKKNVIWRYMIADKDENQMKGTYMEEKLLKWLCECFCKVLWSITFCKFSVMTNLVDAHYDKVVQQDIT